MSNQISGIVPASVIRDSIIDDATRFSGADIPGFTPYAHSGALANLATFTPAANTIVMTAILGGATTTDKLKLQDDHSNYIARPQADGVYGMIGATMCDGTKINYQNRTGAEQTLDLWGLSMS